VLKKHFLLLSKKTAVLLNILEGKKHDTFFQDSLKKESSKESHLIEFFVTMYSESLYCQF